MAIVQISKIQQRSGNLVDLPQLDDAEFGWATDSKRLFIGKSSPNENIEVLTSYSNVSFSQIDGSGGGNLNITAAANGQVLSYDGTNWVNKGGAAGGVITLGSTANIQITGGAIGYVLQTDGTGNLSWTPKTTVTANIKAISNATPMVMTVANTTPYTNAALITISGVAGANADTIVNSKSFYVKVATNFPTTGNVSLYTDASLTTAAVGTNLTATANTGIAVSTISGSGSSAAGGANTSIQFNNNNIIDGSANLTFDFATNLLTVAGNATASNVNTAGTVTASRLISNVATGTAPLTITSTTVVPNLYVARSNVADFGVVTTQTTGTFYPVFVNGNTTANYAHASNANISVSLATGLLTASLLTANGNVTGGNLSTAGTLGVTGNATVGNVNTAGIVTASRLISNIATGTAPLTVTSTTQVANLYVALAGSITTAAQGNITSVGLLTGLTVGNLTSNTIFGNGTITATGNANVGNLGSSGLIVATGNITGGNLVTGGALAVTGNANTGNLGTTTLIATTGNITTINAATVNVSTVINVTATTESTSTTTGSIKTAGGIGAVGNAVIGNGLYVGNGAAATTFVNPVIIGKKAGSTYVQAAIVNTSDTGSADWTAYGDTGTDANAWVDMGFTGSNFSDPAYTITGKNDGYVFVQGDGANVNSGSLVFATGNLGSTKDIVFATGGFGSSNEKMRFLHATSQFYIEPTTASTTTTTGALRVAGGVGVAGNVTVGGNVTTTTITTGANTTAGAITGNWTLTTGSKLQATYADLAEYYSSDAEYEAGTVLEFGGEAEVTVAEDGTNRVAGIVSTDPAYVMNAACAGKYIVALALQGRVPCKVRGTIKKGDMLVSGGDGFARPSTSPTMGSVIGKALANFSGGEGVIEVAVGRL